MADRIWINQASGGLWPNGKPTVSQASHYYPVAYLPETLLGYALNEFLYNCSYTKEEGPDK